MKLGGIYISVGAKTDKLKRDLAKAHGMTAKTAVAMRDRINQISFTQVGVAAIAFGGVLAKISMDGFRAVEQIKLSTASMASTITSFAKNAGNDLAGTYAQAYAYSGQLTLKMEEWNAKTVATGENLSAMVETLAQSGVVLDLNNKEQEKGFLAVANALALITQGQNQDIQFRQEIRGLVNGEVRSTNLLARLLSQRVGGELKKHIEIWKEEGTLIQNAGALLGGFQEGAKDLQNTWLAVGTTLETTYNRVMRGMMLPFYEDVVSMGRQITVELMSQDFATTKLGKTLRSAVHKGWQDIKNITVSVVNIIEGFEAPLLVIGKATGMIADGWGYIFAMLPAITNRIKLITQGIFDSVAMTFRFGETLLHLTMLNFESAATSWEKTKDLWTSSGEKTAAAFAGGFGGEIESSLLKYSKDLTVPIKPYVDAPEMGKAMDEVSEAVDEMNAFFIENAKSVGEQWFDIMVSEHEGAADLIVKEQERMTAEISKHPIDIKVDTSGTMSDLEIYEKEIEEMRRLAETPAEISVIDRATPTINRIINNIDKIQDRSINIGINRGGNSEPQGKYDRDYKYYREIPEIKGFSTGTGLKGLPYTGLFMGHKGEIVKNPSESARERKGDAGNVYNITIAPQFMSGDRNSARSVAVELQKELDIVSMRRM